MWSEIVLAQIKGVAITSSEKKNGGSSSADDISVRCV